jgi:hypothetical protein
VVDLLEVTGVVRAGVPPKSNFGVTAEQTI